MIPLVLVAGFLGAGKTSLLRELLPHLMARGLVPHVVLNDYRNAHVDAVALEGLARHVIPVSGSCVCCDARDDLFATLATLTTPARSVVLLEANGSVDTFALIELLTADRRAARYTAPLQVSVVDAQRWQRRLWNNALERRQVRTAGYLVVNRLDPADPGRAARVDTGLRTLNPRAHRVDVPAFAAAIERITDQAAGQGTRRFTPSAVLAASPSAPTAVDHHAHDKHPFASLEVALPPRVPERALVRFLHALPDAVVRVKGIACLDDGRETMLHVQRLDTPDSVRLTPFQPRRAPAPAAILIGPDLPTPEILGHLRELHAAAGMPLRQQASVSSAPVQLVGTT